jgi:hypothetical protein
VGASVVPEIMPLESYPDQLAPEDPEAVIWRFMKWQRFRQLIETGELYFCRSDLFPNDEREGLSPKEYLPTLRLNPLDISERQELVNHIGSDAQFRESFYISCWHLFREETCKMWQEYGKDGVAVCSRYSLLRSELDVLTDRAFLGLVRYGSTHLTGWNLFRFIMTKRLEYIDEREVRALLWIMDPLAGINRHIDEDNRAHPRPLTLPPSDRVLDGHARKVNLQALITEIVVSPWASGTRLDEINRLIKHKGYLVPVRQSELTRHRDLLP